MSFASALSQAFNIFIKKSAWQKMFFISTLFQALFYILIFLLQSKFTRHFLSLKKVPGKMKKGLRSKGSRDADSRMKICKCDKPTFMKSRVVQNSLTIGDSRCWQVCPGAYSRCSPSHTHHTNSCCIPPVGANITSSQSSEMR